KLAEALGKREVEVALMRPQQERERESTLAAAKASLAAYEQESAPKIAEAQKQKAENTAKLEADLNAYEGPIPNKVPEWGKARSPAVSWLPLNPTSLQTASGATLTKEADGSIVATGTNRNGTFVIVAETDLTDITGVRLEVLPDDRQPSKGPGRAPDGNFVL